MFRFIKIVSVLSLTLVACAQAQTPSDDNFSGTWKNDRGSEVTFKVTGTALSGFYQTNVGQPDKSQKFPLTGFVSGDQITFTVSFTSYGSMTSWTGQMTTDEQGSYIRTLWHLTRDVPDASEEDDLWKSITAGASNFRPVQKSGE